MNPELINIDHVDKSTPSLFELVIPELPFEEDGTDSLLLNIHSVTLPGVDLSPEEYRWQGGIAKRPGANINWADWSVDFVVDEQFLNWFTIYKWLMFQNNNKDKYVETPYKFSTDMFLLIKDNWKRNILKIKFIDVWPVSMGDMTMSSRDGESVLECNVTFTYDRYEVEKINKK